MDFNQETQYVVVVDGEHVIKELENDDNTQEVMPDYEFIEQKPYVDAESEKQETEMEKLKKENNLLNLKINSTTERSDFQEEILAELIYMMYTN